MVVRFIEKKTFEAADGLKLVDYSMLGIRRYVH